MRFLSILIVSFILIINPTLASIVGNEDPETEIYEAKQALKKCEKKKDSNEKRAIACFSFKERLASWLWRFGNLNEAKQIFEEIIQEELTDDVLNYMVSNDAMSKEKRSIIIDYKISTRVSLGNILIMLGNLDEGEQYIYDAINYIESNQTNRKIYYNALDHLYNIAKARLDYDEAFRGYSSLVNIIEKEQGKNSTELISPLKSLGNIKRILGERKEALPYFERALKIADLHKVGPYLKGFIYHNLAITYYEMGHNEKSEKYFDIAIKQRKLAKYYFGLDKSKLFLVRVKIRLKKYKEAKNLLREYENSFYKNYPKNHPKIMNVYTLYMQLYINSNLDEYTNSLIKFNSFVSNYAKGLLSKKFNVPLATYRPNINAVFIDLLNKLSKNDYLEVSSLYKSKTNRNIENDLIELVMLLKTSKINRSVQNLIDRADNNSVVEEKKELQNLIIQYEKIPKFSNDLKEQKKNVKKLKSLKNKISNQKDMILTKLNVSTLANYSKIDLDDIQKELSNDQVIISYFFAQSLLGVAVITSENIKFKHIYTKPEAWVDPDLLSGTIGGIGVQLEVVERLENYTTITTLQSSKLKIHSTMDNSPAYKSGIKAGDYIVKVNEYEVSEKTLTEITNLIMGPINSFVELTIKRKGSKELKKFKVKREITGIVKNLDELISKVRKSVVLNEIGEIPEFDILSSKMLYGVLLPEELYSHFKDKKELIIIPHRSLFSIPFEILIDHESSDRSWEFLQKSSDKDYSKINWLGKKYAISYYPSIYSFYNLNKIKFKQAKNDFVGFGDPLLATKKNSQNKIDYTKLFTRGVANAEEIRNMDELPETADELKSIAKIFKGNSKLYLREDFNEEAVKTANLNDYKIISFATHAVIANQINNIAEPGLILTPPDKPTEINDGILTVSEIEKLDLQSDIVVLSACNTAAQDGSPNAEGLSGLASAFFHAGTKSILVTHWDVETNSAVRLTTGTFSKMKETKNLSQALHLTKLEMLNNKETSHPIFWAPFVLIGNVTQAIN